MDAEAILRFECKCRLRATFDLNHSIGRTAALGYPRPLYGNNMRLNDARMNNVRCGEPARSRNLFR